jgi:uncharacterized coiled-coil protein SlyX
LLGGVSHATPEPGGEYVLYADHHARIAELESELAEQARLNGMGSEREAAKDGRIAEQQAIIDKLPHAVTSTTGTLLAAFRFECHADAYRDNFQGSGLPTIALQAEPMPWKSISTRSAALAQLKDQQDATS